MVYLKNIVQIQSFRWDFSYEEYKKAVEELEEAKVLSKEEDKEIREMAQMELEELEPKIQNYLDRLMRHHSYNRQ